MGPTSPKIGEKWGTHGYSATSLLLLYNRFFRSSGVSNTMIRFMQTSAAFKKYALVAILGVVIISMAWYLVPTFSGQGLGASNVPVVATVAGNEVTADAVRKQAQKGLQQQFPRGGAQAAALLPMF